MLRRNHKQSKHYKQKIQELAGEPLLDHHFPNKKEGKLDKVESARQTRIRKKIYIGLLEDKLRLRDEEIIQLKLQLVKARQERPKAPPHPSTEALKYRTDLFTRIEQSVRNQDQQQTRNFLDILRLCYGVSGEQRKVLLENSLKQYIEYMMPMHFRYLLDSCHEKKQFYELFAENEQYRLHMNFNFLELNQKRELATVRPLLCEYRHSYNHIIEQIWHLKQLVLKQNSLSQKVVDRLSRAFKPCFLAEFLLKLDQKRTTDKKVNAIYPLSYWEYLGTRSEQQQRRKFINEVQSYNVSEYRFNERNEQVEGVCELSELDFIM